MRSRLVGSFVALTVVILVVFGIPLRSFVENVERERLITSLERDAFILAGHAKETLDIESGSELPSLEPFIADDAQRTEAKVVVTNQSGVVIASNDDTLTIGTSFANRPEIQRALKGEPAVGERTSSTLGEDLVFVAVPVLSGEDVLGAVRFSNPQSVIDDEVNESLLGIALAGLFTVLAGVALAIPVALRIAQPISRLRKNADALARGEFNNRANAEQGPKEIRELAMSFNTMSSRLGLMMKGQREFNSAVSHQLRTPLTALRLRLEYLERSISSDDKEVMDAVEASQDEVDRLQEIIEQLLNLARMESGVIPQVEVDVNKVVSQRLEMWAPLAEERDVHIVSDVEPGLSCKMIEGGLDQILDNYIDNALGVSEAGQTITIRGYESARRIVVEVQDLGPGLNDEERVDAFDRFWRSVSNQNKPGTGLGLAIVRQIAAASGAEVRLLNREDARRGLIARVVCATA